jgi:predicted RNA-binding protein YlqC (UPF0109 family)
MATLTDTLNYILQSIVSSETTISLETREENGVSIIDIIAPAEVTGQIIGKQGKTIKAIRTLLNLSYPNQRYLLEIKN